jgi:O-acetyl-ADP-ribose deacetylase (regulator of RNase III)
VGSAKLRVVVVGGGVDVAINEGDVRARKELAVVVIPVELEWLNVGSATVLAATRIPVGLGWSYVGSATVLVGDPV